MGTNGGKREAEDVRNRIPWSGNLSMGMVPKYNTYASMMIPNAYIPVVG
jgi:hypothetical protein